MPKRLLREVFKEVFEFVRRVAGKKGRVLGEKLGNDAITIQANASRKSIDREDSEKVSKDCMKKLA
jgi:transposase